MSAFFPDDRVSSPGLVDFDLALCAYVVEELFAMYARADRRCPGCGEYGGRDVGGVLEGDELD